MFYSHTFLARKGPLGTVWCAAHLQHKLKKSHYIATNVPSTVQRIMFPEVPIALRMSGHLLLGVVRIYSKQVDYLYEDCNEIRITINRVFTTVNVNLPHDATHAPPHSVTLPEKLDFDALDLDDYYKDLGEDSHFKSLSEITLTEQIPTGKDPYIIIHFDEQDLRVSSLIEDDSGIGPTPMDEDVPPTVELDTVAGLNDPSTSNQLGADNRNAGNSSPQKSIEIMRDAARGFDFNNSPILPNRAAPDKFLEEQISKDNENLTPATEEILFPDGNFSSAHNHEEQQHSLGQLNSPTPFGGCTVYMKNLLNDTSNIRRVRRECPSSSLAIWKQNNTLRLRKDDVICEPFIHEENQETSIAQPPLSSRDGNIEIETLRNNERASPERDLPSLTTALPSPGGRSYFTPEKSNLGLQSEQRMDTTGGNGLLTTGDVGPSGNLDSEMETPDMSYDRGFQDEHTALSDIPELVASAGDLGFLDQDDNSPAGPEGTPEIGMFSKNLETPELQALSSRTRQSSVTPILENSDESPEVLSLNKILEGKPRKICARMFFETLVLRTHGLVDGHQENPYDDITLKVTPKLSKGQVSG
ncbi:sister chromatid cohesion 1 protein 3 [Phtheirospermum japonicum]|uniref:Sister chromatid cohesion 1 protein 3 n=1 Tax=Phtheirospermum japonicum TaxID=374723 RepID=A0A830C0C0_9LAMI|nr:sister chromatid cohesion 1 protein 3 [Phtheirospermum japonicum]